MQNQPGSYCTKPARFILCKTSPVHTVQNQPGSYCTKPARFILCKTSPVHTVQNQPGSHCAKPARFILYKTSPDHTVQNQPGSAWVLADYVRFVPNGSGPEASRCTCERLIIIINNSYKALVSNQSLTHCAKSSGQLPANVSQPIKIGSGSDPTCFCWDCVTASCKILKTIIDSVRAVNKSRYTQHHQSLGGDSPSRMCLEMGTSGKSGTNMTVGLLKIEPNREKVKNADFM